MNTLTDNFIDTSLRDKVYKQDYSPKSSIDGVLIIKIKNFVGENGDFSELLRLNESGESEAVPGFKVRQINRSKQYTKAVKAWHLHYNQDEIWYVPPDEHLLLGLWDVRDDSTTKGTLKNPLRRRQLDCSLYPPGSSSWCSKLFREKSKRLLLCEQSV